MFLLLLGGTLVLGWGLVATASVTDGALIASRSTALAIGWLLACASFVGLRGLRQASWEQRSATAITFVCSAVLLYLSYFEWGSTPPAPVPVAAAANVDRGSEHQVAAASAAVTVVAPIARVHPPVPQPIAQPAQPVAVTDACFALEGVEFLQCSRCADTAGLRRAACHERARLEYCEGRQDDAAACPTA